MQYSALELWLLIGLLALVTLGARSFFVLLPRRWQPRGRMEQALRHAPLAALLAIIAPEVIRQLPAALQTTHPLWAAASDARLLSALVLVGVVRATRSTLWGLLAGIATFLLRGFLGP
jgi:branched-subunit amino acid transport protein